MACKVTQQISNLMPSVKSGVRASTRIKHWIDYGATVSVGKRELSAAVGIEKIAKWRIEILRVPIVRKKRQ